MIPSNTPPLDQNILFPLIETMRELTRILSHEMTLLQNRRPQELKEFLPEKTKLMAAYQKEIAGISSRGGLQASGSGNAIRTLKQVSRTFNETLEKHTRMTKALKTISEKTLKAISDEVIKTQNRAKTYGANGAKFSSQSATSISLNQTI